MPISVSMLKARPQQILSHFGLEEPGEARRRRHSPLVHRERAHLGDEPVPVLARHLEVADEDVGAMNLQGRQRGRRRLDREHRGAIGLERLGE